MATEYSCVQCGSDMPEKDIQVCMACTLVINMLHKVELQFHESHDSVLRYRGRCKACGETSPWAFAAGIAHGWESRHQQQVAERLHEAFFDV